MTTGLRSTKLAQLGVREISSATIRPSVGSTSPTRYNPHLRDKTSREGLIDSEGASARSNLPRETVSCRTSSSIHLLATGISGFSVLCCTLSMIGELPRTSRTLRAALAEGRTREPRPNRWRRIQADYKRERQTPGPARRNHGGSCRRWLVRRDGGPRYHAPAGSRAGYHAGSCTRRASGW